MNFSLISLTNLFPVLNNSATAPQLVPNYQGGKKYSFDSMNYSESEGFLCNEYPPFMEMLL